jgi:hypothetical protein
LKVNGRSSARQNALEDSGGISGHADNRNANGGFLGQAWDFWAMRLALTGATCVLCYSLGPFGIHGWPAAGLGFLVAMLILLAELRLRRAEISGLVGGACGATLGLLASLLITLIISRTAESEPTKTFLEFTSLFAFGYLGLVIGSFKGNTFRHVPLPPSVVLPADSRRP